VEKVSIIHIGKHMVFKIRNH